MQQVTWAGPPSVRRVREKFIMYEGAMEPMRLEQKTGTSSMN